MVPHILATIAGLHIISPENLFVLVSKEPVPYIGVIEPKTLNV